MQLKNLWNEKNVTLSFEVFPNKKDSDFETVRAAADVSLLDCSGRRLQHFKPQNSEFTIDLSGLPAGTYLLHSQGLTRTLVKHR